MLTIDYILLAALLVSIVVGVFRGFFREALSLVTWVAALWIALRFSAVLEPMLASISSEALRIWSARLIMFVLVLIAGGLLNALIGILVTKTGLTGTDRMLGMVFGAARGVLIVGIVVMMFRLLDLDREAWWSESRLIPLALPVADALQSVFHEGLGRLEEWVPPASPPGDLAPDAVEPAGST